MRFCIWLLSWNLPPGWTGIEKCKDKMWIARKLNLLNLFLFDFGWIFFKHFLYGCLIVVVLILNSIQTEHSQIWILKRKKSFHANFKPQKESKIELFNTDFQEFQRLKFTEHSGLLSTGSSFSFCNLTGLCVISNVSYSNLSSNRFCFQLKRC